MARAAERSANANVRTAIDVVAQLRTVNKEAHTVLDAAKAAGDGALSLQAIDRITRQIELQARLIDLIGDGPTVNILIAPEWQMVQGILMAALGPYPEARAAVAGKLMELESGGG
jgi:hypothetical protein